MYRLLATDIDDTILCGDGSLPEANRAALAHLHAPGIPVVFSSGRADVSTRAVAQRILTPLDSDHIIAFSGAHVGTPKLLLIGDPSDLAKHRRGCGARSDRR